MVNWAPSKMLTIAPSKSTITLFTPDKARESSIHPQVNIGGEPIPLAKTPKILGVRLDTHFSFAPHVKDVVRSAKERLNILRSLSGSTWGCQKETLLTSFKVYVEPVLNYAAPIWSPNASASAISSIQRVQNRALRIATGCHSVTSIDHLHQETQTAFVADHLSMVSAQFLAGHPISFVSLIFL